jgi:4-hydroxybenzoyl-CoA thioesterase
VRRTKPSEENGVPATIYRVTVQWGDCDPAGIVFYPNFFSYFDQATWHLFAQVGMTLSAMQARGAIGIPIVDAQANFKVPCRFGDVLEIESFVSEWKERTFKVRHIVRQDGREHLHGYEMRIWGMQHPHDPARLQAAAVPADVRAALEKPGEAP